MKKILRANKTLIPVIGIVLILLIVTIAQLTKTTTKSTPQTKNNLPKLTGTQIAMRSIQFIEFYRMPNNIYYMWSICPSKDKCQPDENPKNNVTGNGHIIDFYLTLAEKTGDKSYKEKIDKTVEAWLAECEKPDGGKYTLATSCRKNFRLFSAYYKETGNIRYLNAMKRVEATMFSEQDMGKLFTSKSFSKLGYLYKASGEKKYLTRLQELGKRVQNGELDRAFEASPSPTLYQEGNLKVTAPLLSSITEVYISLYEATEDEFYLKKADEILTKTNPVGHPAEMIESNKVNLFQDVLEGMLELTELTNDQKYIEQAYKLAQEGYIALADTPENPKFARDYSFILSPSEPNRRNLTDNGALALIYLELGDRQFAQTK